MICTTTDRVFIKDFKGLAENSGFLSWKFESNEYVRTCLQCRVNVICVDTVF